VDILEEQRLECCKEINHRVSEVMDESNLNICAKKSEGVVWGRKNFQATWSTAKRRGKRKLEAAVQKERHPSQNKATNGKTTKGPTIRSRKLHFLSSVSTEVLVKENILRSWHAKTSELRVRDEGEPERKKWVRFG
jgi:hypothetical protein